MHSDYQQNTKAHEKKINSECVNVLWSFISDFVAQRINQFHGKRDYASFLSCMTLGVGREDIGKQGKERRLKKNKGYGTETFGKTNYLPFRVDLFF